MNIFNVRFGLATNSSSSHSLIFFKDKPIPVDYNNDEEGNFGWGFFTAASEESKLRYLGIMLRDRIYRTLPEYVANLICKDWLGKNIVNSNDYIDHQSVMIIPNQFNTIMPDKEFFEDLKKFFLNKELVILGGNDNNSYSHPLDEGDSFRLPIPRDTSSVYVCRKDRKYDYWTLFCPEDGRKIRFNFSDDPQKIEADPTKASAPELVDIKITDFCPFGCEFCYQGSTTKGKHAEYHKIYQITYELSAMKVFEVAIGGGEPTLHPNFGEILENFRTNGIVPNFTTRNLNWLRDPKKWIKWLKYAGAFAFSASKEEEIKELNSILQYNGIEKSKVNIHLVMGTMSESEFERILTTVAETGMAVTLLGFKKTGFGIEYTYIPYSWWLECVQSIKKETPVDLSIDTLIASEFEQKIIDAGVPKWMFTVEEGKFSCYIDAVNMQIGPSSYCDKSKMIKIEERHAIIDAFSTF